jgi:hypothetical protein
MVVPSTSVFRLTGSDPAGAALVAGVPVVGVPIGGMTAIVVLLVRRDRRSRIVSGGLDTAGRRL